jgi:hypothetical protein
MGYRVLHKRCLKAPFAFALHLWGYGFGDIPAEIRKHPYTCLLSKRCNLVKKHERFLNDKDINFSLRGYIGSPQVASLSKIARRKLKYIVSVHR